MSAAPPTLGVVVLATRGGEHLAEALSAVAWADRLAVLAPDRTVPLGDLPPDVVVAAESGQLATLDAGWLLVLSEAERIPSADAATLRRAIASAGSSDGFTLQPVSVLLDLETHAARRCARLAPRTTPLEVRGGAGPEFARRGRRWRPVEATVLRARGTSLSEALALAGAEGDALAALVDRGGGSLRAALWRPLAAAIGAARGRAVGRPLGLGRVVVAAFEGYRVMITYAKLWERRRDRMVVG